MAELEIKSYSVMPPYAPNSNLFQRGISKLVMMIYNVVQLQCQTKHFRTVDILTRDAAAIEMQLSYHVMAPCDFSPLGKLSVIG